MNDSANIKQVVEKLAAITELLAKEIESLVKDKRSVINNSDQTALAAHHERVYAIQAVVSQLHTIANINPDKTDQ